MWLGKEHWIGPSGKLNTEVTTDQLPDYLGDLNAMHEAEKVLTGIQLAEYSIWLQKIEDYDFLATAAQRAEAFLKTLGLWIEEPVSAATVEGLR